MFRSLAFRTAARTAPPSAHQTTSGKALLTGVWIAGGSLIGSLLPNQGMAQASMEPLPQTSAEPSLAQAPAEPLGQAPAEPLGQAPAELLGQAPAEPGDAAFVAGTEDLPLMPGLRQVPDTGMVFETGQGRLVEAYAVGPVTNAMVSAFYTQTLPQLGWQLRDTGDFYREGETLRIDVLPGDGAHTVRFRISPTANRPQ